MPTTRRAPSMSASKCPPQLPRTLLRELLRDPVVAGGHISFSQSEYDGLRGEVAIRAQPVDHIWPLGGMAYQGTLLQIAATMGDLPLAYEMIRLGANINATDQFGRTPLFIAVQAITTLDLFPEEHQPPVPNILPGMGPRSKMVASLLIEQHADVNVILNNETCLTLTMRAKVKQWDLIELLITHGAREDLGTRNGVVQCAEEKERISELLRMRPKKRPPRLCPCFSRRLLADCHGKGPRPFPYHFFCPCQSRSVYAKCCKKRKVSWRDVWNEERRIIEPWRKEMPIYLPLSQDATNIISGIRRVYGTPIPVTEMVRRRTDVPLAVTQLGLPPEMEDRVMLPLCLCTLMRSESVDRAFGFAVAKVVWHVRPLGRKVPKKYAAGLARAFNKHVDDEVRILVWCSLQGL
ncbi:hypothetical protein BD410DRAFT_898322 [Rickenella mellea]|uniref:Uncharacterized protein n=1 Tax=Rickenella mellea TaxID=50990 RepID=A0A4Y7Q500_9AGAM|nr:hypothetical protein BD410DRAFT_898322 [Rickenella mellea]